MDERLTDGARTVLRLANEEAVRFNHEYIGTEHILLGLIKEASGVGATVLKNLNADLVRVRREVEKIIQRGPDMDRMVTKVPPTPRAKKVIEYAIEEARNLNQNCVGSEHLLLGLIREVEGVASQVLINLGLSLPVIRDEVLRLLGHEIPARAMRSNEPTKSNVPPRIDEAIQQVDGLVELLTQMLEQAVANADFEWAVRVRDEREKLRELRDFLRRAPDHEPPEKTNGSS